MGNVENENILPEERIELRKLSPAEIGAQFSAQIQIAEMMGWSNDLRSATEGRGVSSLSDQLFERVPQGLQAEVIRKIRERKGLAENQ